MLLFFVRICFDYNITWCRCASVYRDRWLRKFNCLYFGSRSYGLFQFKRCFSRFSIGCRFHRDGIFYGIRLNSYNTFINDYLITSFVYFFCRDYFPTNC